MMVMWMKSTLHLVSQVSLLYACSALFEVGLVSKITSPAGSAFESRIFLVSFRAMKQEIVRVTRQPEGYIEFSWPATLLQGPVSIYWSRQPDRFDRNSEPLAVAAERDKITIPDPSLGQRPYFLLVSAGDKSLVTAERRLPLEGEVNFRDLGGYAGAGGRTIKWGQLYRSGELGRLSESDLTYLTGLNLSLVCDLRIDYEVAHSPDRLPGQTRWLGLPVRGGEMPMATLYEAVNSGDLAKIDSDFLLQGNRLFVRDFTPTYAKMLRRLMDPGGRPGLVHCTAGKDRAGLGSAILLWVLGVPMETVFDDYLRTNVYRAQENEKLLTMVKQAIMERTSQPAEALDLEPMEALLEARREYLQMAVDTILKDYGSIESYIRRGLRVSHAVQRAFQESLLE
jgi:protein-tyrosine phosphatase